MIRRGRSPAGQRLFPVRSSRARLRDAEALRPAEHAVPQDGRGDRRRQRGGVEDAGDVVPDQRGRPVAQCREQPLAGLLVVAARGVRPDLGDVPGRERRDAGGQQGLARPLHRRVHGERRRGRQRRAGDGRQQRREQAAARKMVDQRKAGERVHELGQRPSDLGSFRCARARRPPRPEARPAARFAGRIPGRPGPSRPGGSSAR